MSAKKDLLERARSFDEAALAEIYDDLSTDLYRYAMRLLGDQNLAEDCVAETFSRFLHALHRGGGPRNHLRAYLYRIAHNWITDYFRRNHPVPMPELPEIDMDRSSDPSQVVHDKLENVRVRAALAQLTPDQRQVITLKYLEGWQNKEVAQAMQKPVGSIKALQHRGLASLRRVLLREEKMI